MGIRLENSTSPPDEINISYAFAGTSVRIESEGLALFVSKGFVNSVFVRSGDRAQSNVGGTYMEPNYALWSWSTIGTKMEHFAGAQFRLAHDFPAPHSPG